MAQLDASTDQMNNENEDPISFDENEFKELIDYINDLRSKDEAKKIERDLNHTNTIAKNPVDLSKFDSSIKKNSAFVKKLKNLTELTKDSVLKDISTLNISKYLTEVVAALVELKLKTSEIALYLEVCSKIRRMYPEFPSLFLEQWKKSLPKNIQEITNYSKLRNDLRIFSELILNGIFGLKDSLQILGNLLKLLLSEKQVVNLNVVLNFCKNCGWYYAGLVPRRLILLAHKHKEQIPCSSFLSSERQKNLRMLLKNYYAQVCKQIVADHRALKRREYENKKVLIKRGELSEKKKNIYEENKMNFQKFWLSVQQLGELLNEDLPELKADDPEELDKSLLNIDSSGIRINSIDVPLFEDENSRAFYEQLPNLKNEIPAHLYKDSIKEKYQKSKKEEKKDKIDRLENKEFFERIEQERPEFEKQSQESSNNVTIELSDEALAKNLTKELINDESEDESDNIENALEKFQSDSDDEDNSKVNKKSNTLNGKSLTISTKDPQQTMKITLDELLNMLLNCMTKETIDKAAYDFSMNFNSKSNRKKLIRALFTCPRTRLDLLPFFARFVAIVNPIMPLVGSDLVYLLKKDFRFHLNRKDQINIESKIKTMRYIGELTKFNIFPKEETMQCLKILILDFSHHQIEMACNLLEVCGRFLYLSPSTHIKCNLLLQQMLRKKSLIPIQTKYISMIENAYYYSCPNLQNTGGGQLIQSDFRQQEPKEQLSDVQLYFKFLIYKELDRKNLEKVLNLIRRFDYTDKEFVTFAVKCISEVWLVKYFNIKYLANCLSALSQYQPMIGHQVIDNIFEEMHIMIEINSIRYNQRRIASVKYLGELYNYRLIDSSVVINALYMLLSYGVNPNYEKFDIILKDKASKMLNQEKIPKEKIENSSTLKRSKSLTDLKEINEQLLENGESELDTADNLMRIRLICILLDTCVPYINTISGKRKLGFFVFFFQLYFYRKKIIYLLNEDKDDAVFPIDIEFAFVDSVRRVKSKFKFSKNYNDAFNEVRKLIKKLVPKIKKLVPKVKIMPKNKSVIRSNLKAITEIDEEEELEDESEQESDEDEESGDEDLENTDQSDEEELNNPSQESTENQEFENFENDEFQREFDQIVSESLAGRSSDNVRNMNTDIVIPISKLNNLNNANEKQATSFITSFDSGQPITLTAKPAKEQSIKVIVMTKSKNNKQILKPVQVPLDSDFAKNLKEKEKAEREEKEKVKKLTLDINERREMEDQERSNQNLSLNVNRDNRRKINHYRGVPNQDDLNQIFGTNRKK